MEREGTSLFHFTTSIGPFCTRSQYTFLHLLFLCGRCSPHREERRGSPQTIQAGQKCSLWLMKATQFIDGLRWRALLVLPCFWDPQGTSNYHCILFTLLIEGAGFLLPAWLETTTMSCGDSCGSSSLSGVPSNKVQVLLKASPTPLKMEATVYCERVGGLTTFQNRQWGGDYIIDRSQL